MWITRCPNRNKFLLQQHENLISNNKNIDSPISLKTFILEKYKLNDLQLFAFEDS
jgi:hypothetical protein